MALVSRGKAWPLLSSSSELGRGRQSKGAPTAKFGTTRASIYMMTVKDYKHLNQRRISELIQGDDDGRREGGRRKKK